MKHILTILVACILSTTISAQQLKTAHRGVTTTTTTGNTKKLQKMKRTAEIEQAINQSIEPIIQQYKPDNSSANISDKVYKIGDYYNDGKKEGVVFEVTPDGKHGKIVSMVESNQEWTSDNIDKRYLIGAYSQTDGAYNTSRVKVLPKWKNKYPAFSWCDHLGNGWYVPSIEELKTFVTDTDVHNIVNSTILEHKGTKIHSVADGNFFYLSSTESGKSLNTVCVYAISIGKKKSEIAEMPKKWSYSVRAVAIF